MLPSGDDGQTESANGLRGRVTTAARIPKKNNPIVLSVEDVVDILRQEKTPLPNVINK